MPTLNLNFRMLWIPVLAVALLAGCTGTKTNSHPVAVAESEEQARQAVEEIFRAYEQKDLIAVMDRVSNDYLGNRAEFERDLDDQLRQVDSIDYEWFISRVRPEESDQTIDVRFRWDRRWRAVDTGNETRRSGQTTFRLVRENGRYLIKDIQQNNPFL